MSLVRFRFWALITKYDYARVAQLVEHDLAKVGVAGSSPVSRSFYTQKGVLKKDPLLCIKRAHGARRVRGLGCRFGRCIRRRPQDAMHPVSRGKERCRFMCRIMEVLVVKKGGMC